MIQLPLISSRSAASKSAYHRPPPQPAKQPQSLVDKFHLMTKVTNYEGLSQQQVWKQYEKLRHCLKMLNESVLEEIEKRQVVLRKQSPRKRTTTESLNIIEEECKTVVQAIRLSSIELTSNENKLEYVAKLDIRQMQGEYQKLKLHLAALKSEIKAMSTKTFLMSKNLTKGPSALEKLLQSTAELQFLEMKVFRQNNRLQQSKQIMSTCFEKLEELEKTEEKRQDQYKLFEEEKKEEDNILHYQQLTSTKNDIEKYESPLKKNYFLKLKELEGLVNSIQQGETKINEVEMSILKIKGVIESTEGKTVAMRRQLKKEDMGRFNHSMMEMRDSDPTKPQSEKETQKPTQKLSEDKCF